jgi:malate permease and related proteins
MELIGLITRQILLMMLLIMVGIVAYKQKWITDEGSKQMSALLVNVVTPFVVISVYQTPFVMERAINLIITFGLSIIAVGISVMLSIVLVKPKQDVERFALFFPNTAFFGIPVISAVFGSSAVFYLMGYIITVTLVAFTYGIYLYTHKKSAISIRKALLNPGSLGFLVGIILFVSPIKLPPLVFSFVTTVASLNTPLAMIVLGTYIAHLSFSTFFSRELFIISFYRLIIIPLAVIAILAWIPTDATLKMIVVIASSAPVGMLTAIFAQRHDRRTGQASKLVSFSTVFSALTIPLMVAIQTLVSTLT